MDKQAGTTAAAKKYVDNRYLIWFTEVDATICLWKTEEKCIKPGNYQRIRKIEGEVPKSCKGEAIRMPGVRGENDLL